MRRLDYSLINSTDSITFRLKTKKKVHSLT